MTAMAKKEEKRKNKFTEEELRALNVCPNCWNEMSYYNEYMNYVEDRTKTHIHGPKESSSNKAFIEQYVQDNVTGIQLKNDKNRDYCPNCHTEYLKEPGEVDDQDKWEDERDEES